jgi:hypothetical protein
MQVAGATVSNHGEFAMTLTNLALWAVLIGLFAIVPIGCVMTRPKKKPLAAAE